MSVIEFERSFPVEMEMLRAKDGDASGRTAVGIIVPYDTPVPIYNEGIVEQVARGAANHQLAAASRVKLFQGHSRQGGKHVGGARELRDDARGLWAAMHFSSPDGDGALGLVRDGHLDELSIGFRQRKASWSEVMPDGTVLRKRMDIFEVALVTEGAYGRGAKVTSLRSANGLVVDDEAEDEPPAREIIVPARLSAETLRKLADLRA